MSAYPAAWKWALEILKACLRKIGATPGTVFAGEEAFNYLVRIRDALVARAAEFVNLEPSSLWIRLIRSLDRGAFAKVARPQIDGDTVSAFRIADNLVGMSVAGPTETTFSVPASRDRVMKLARLMALADIIDSAEGQIRSATKGVQYRVHGRLLPRAVDSSDLLANLSEFDIRNGYLSIERWQEELGSESDAPAGSDLPLLAAYAFRTGFALDRVWEGVLRGTTSTRDYVQFTVRRFTTGDSIHAALGKGSLVGFNNPEATVATVIFAHALLRRVLDRDEHAGSSLTRYGLLEISEKELADEIDLALLQPAVVSWLTTHDQAQLSALRVRDLVHGLYEPGRRSFPGKPIHSDPSTLLIDVASLTWHLDVGLRVDPRLGGALVNASAEEFELTTQALIDATPYAPPTHLKHLRGTTLRLKGRPVTDVDALLVVGKKLLFVSCKRVTLGIDYLSGEYKSARNAQSRIDVALDDWATRIALLAANPVGDNYDISGYELDGFVLVPELVFTSSPTAREFVELEVKNLFLTRVESLDQLVAVLEMASSPRFGPSSRHRRLRPS